MAIAGPRKGWGFLAVSAVLLGLSGRALDAGDLFAVETIPRVVGQGEVCLVRASVPEGVEVVSGDFRGRRFPMLRARHPGVYEGLLGIDMNTASGTYPLRVTARKGNEMFSSEVFPLKVKKVAFDTQHLRLPSSMVDLDSETLARVKREAERLKAIWEKNRDERLWRGPFVRPVGGTITTAFGLRRVINGEPRSPHSGVDMRAPEGTPIRACNAGIVVLVDELFFTGKSVILDHGWGMYSAYFHLSEALVRQGQKVAKGAVIGRAGSTGRATGPHLHWGIRINGARVDPLSLIRLAGYLEE